VYIPRRDTNSRLNALVGGRLFPGEHRRAIFDCEETHDRVSIWMRSRDGTASITVISSVTDGWPADSVFHDADDASAFFEQGALGFSPRSGTADLDALELETVEWSVVPLAVEDVGSSFFGDLDGFPVGSATFDNALLMRDIDHRWHQRQPLCGCEDHVGRPPDSTAGRQDTVPASR
jgi:hypothetical protein